MLQLIDIEEEYSDTLSSYNEIGRYGDNSKTMDNHLSIDIETIKSFIEFDEVKDIYVNFLKESITGLSLNDFKSVNPIPKVDNLWKVADVMDEEKSTEEYLTEALTDLEDDEDISSISNVDVYGFISYCESFYEMDTNTFLNWFKENGNEGNAEMKLWAIYARNLGIGNE